MQPIGFNGPVIPAPAANSLDFTNRPSQFGPDRTLFVSCIRCRRLHSTTQPFTFNPVCPECAGRMGSLTR